MPDDRIAAQARAVAAHFEAKKDALRQVQTGEWKLTLTVLDLPPWLMTARMGTRLMAALVEIDDDETPVSHAVERVSARPEQDSGAPKVDTKDKSEAARERFKQLGSPEQLVAKCAMLCADRRFQRWLHVNDEDSAARAVRLLCQIKSRTELASNHDAQLNWFAMVTDYDIWRGALPEKR